MRVLTLTLMMFSVLPAALPAAYLTELIEWSHSKALASLSKARRDRLLVR